MNKKIKNKIRYFLKDVVDNRGRNPENYFDSEKYPVIDNFLIENKIYPDLKKVKRYINQKTYDSFLRKYLEKDDVLITLVGNGFCSVSLSPSNEVVIIQNTIGLQTNEKLYNKFLYYYLILQQKNLVKLNRSSSQPSLNQQDLLDYEIEVPENIQDQQKIASILFTLDAKIELNNRINDELEQMVKTLYEYWFVQFDFPNKNSKPYKTSGGKMTWSKELKREIPEGWEVKKISDLLPVLTGKQDANFSTENGKYNFFTCGEEILKCNSFEFEGKSVLVAGNGNFNIKLYEGKFNAYQRTYVLIPEDERYYTVVYLAVKDRIASLTKGSRGSIVKFITKGDLENIQIPLPRDKSLDIFSALSITTKKIEKNIEENQKLAKLRDWLLPMLMNGQVSIK